jgi:putative hydrolase of the HAD superfamily
MAAIKAIFWDVGGVLLTNAWDRHEREQAITTFQLDPIEFNDRHEMVVSSFERGKISLDDYLARTVFYRQRPFTRDTFKEYMFSRSQADPESLTFARELAGSGKYLMGTINNESTELNLYRIERFGLRQIFDVFVSSCFVGYRKPEHDIYRLALEVTQQSPEECCFVDDRDLNLEAAHAMGMHTIRMENTEQLRGELQKVGVSTS